jgi:hypothetical protein
MLECVRECFASNTAFLRLLQSCALALAVRHTSLKCHDRVFHNGKDGNGFRKGSRLRCLTPKVLFSLKRESHQSEQWSIKETSNGNFSTEVGFILTLSTVFRNGLYFRIRIFFSIFAFFSKLDMTLAKVVLITVFIFLVTTCAGEPAVNVALNARAIITVTSTTTGPATTVAVTAQPTSTTPMKTETPNSALAITTSPWIYLVAASITWILRR